MIHFLIKKILFILLFIIIEYVSKIFLKIKILKFIEIIPKISLDNKNFPNLKQLFKSRQLYINEANLTNEYIRFIKPINEKEEKKYKKKGKEKNIKFTENFFNKRKGQYDFKEFGKICSEEQLIDSNIIINNNNPLISVILPTYNKENTLMKSIRSIQNQSLKNIEIIIVNDGSTDNSEKIFGYLLKSDPRIRVFRHLKNLGVWRTRIDGLLYSNAKYVIHFDCGDLYYDNYVLEDLYNIIEKYHLDSVKMFFRSIYDFKDLTSYKIQINNKINYTKIVNKKDIEHYNLYIMRWAYGIIWNRLVRSDIFTKGLCLLSDTVLNFYKNFAEDIWWDKIANEVSSNLLIVKRFGYLYFRDNKGEGTIKLRTSIDRDRMINEYLKFLYFDYEFIPQKSKKNKIIKQLLVHNKTKKGSALKHIKTRFYILDNLLYKLLNDSYIRKEDKIKLCQLLIDSLKRQKNENN